MFAASRGTTPDVAAGVGHTQTFEQLQTAQPFTARLLLQKEKSKVSQVRKDVVGIETFIFDGIAPFALKTSFFPSKSVRVCPRVMSSPQRSSVLVKSQQGLAGPGSSTSLTSDGNVRTTHYSNSEAFDVYVRVDLEPGCLRIRLIRSRPLLVSLRWLSAETRRLVGEVALVSFAHLLSTGLKVRNLNLGWRSGIVPAPNRRLSMGRRLYALSF